MHDDEQRIMKLRESERMEHLSPYDVARWFDVPPHLITLPELTEGERLDRAEARESPSRKVEVPDA